MTEIDALLQKGIQTAKTKQFAEAQKILKQVIKLDPRNEIAWLWLSGVVTDKNLRVQCLKRVLTINPQNKPAQQGLKILEEQTSSRNSSKNSSNIDSPSGKQSFSDDGKNVESQQDNQQRLQPVRSNIKTVSPSSTPTKKATTPQKPKAQPSSLKIGCWLIIAAFIIGFVACGLIWTFSGNDTTDVANKPSIGDTGILYVEGSESVFIAVDEAALDEILKSINANDKYGLAELVLAGRVFSVQNRTKVRVIDMKGFTLKIRILEGEYSGYSAWVPHEFVVKQ